MCNLDRGLLSVCFPNTYLLHQLLVNISGRCIGRAISTFFRSEHRYARIQTRSEKFQPSIVDSSAYGVSEDWICVLPNHLLRFSALWISGTMLGPRFGAVKALLNKLIMMSTYASASFHGLENRDLSPARLHHQSKDSVELACKPRHRFRSLL